MEFLEFSISGVTIGIFGFSIDFYFTNVNFLIVIFFEEVSPYFWRKTGLNVDVIQKVETSEHFQSASRLPQPKRESFCKSTRQAGTFPLGTWWKILGWLVRREAVWRSGFYNVKSEFWRNRRIRIANQR